MAHARHMFYVWTAPKQRRKTAAAPRPHNSWIRKSIINSTVTNAFPWHGSSAWEPRLKQPHILVWILILWVYVWIVFIHLLRAPNTPRAIDRINEKVNSRLDRDSNITVKGPKSRRFHAKDYRHFTVTSPKGHDVKALFKRCTYIWKYSMMLN